MPDAKTITAAVSLAVAGAAVGFAVRTPSAAITTAAIASGPQSAPPLPSRCKQACDSLASWCPAGRAVNCVDLLERFQREGRVSCDDGISTDELAKIEWCPEGGATVVIK